MSSEYLKDYKVKVEKNIRLINQLIEKSIIDGDNLIRELAASWVDLEDLEIDYEQLVETVKDHQRILNIFSSEMQNPKLRDPELSRSKILKMFQNNGSRAATLINKGLQIQRTSIARRIANARHDKPGGSREKQQKIREIWASGKFSSRDICAEQECAALEMSFSTARKALRNTPTP